MSVLEFSQKRAGEPKAAAAATEQAAPNLATASFSTSPTSETQTVSATPSLTGESLSSGQTTSRNWREALNDERKGGRRNLTLVTGTSPLAPDQEVSADMAPVVWISLRNRELLFHGTSTSDSNLLTTAGVAKHLAVVNTGEVQRFSGLFFAATGQPFALAGDYTSTKTYVSMSRENAEEFANRPGGETAQRILEAAPILLASPRVSAADKAWLREVSGRINEYSANSRPIVLGIAGAALDLLHPNDAEASGARGQDFVQQQLSFVSEVNGRVTFGGFLNHLSTNINELSLSRVRPSDIMAVYPLAA